MQIIKLLNTNKLKIANSSLDENLKYLIIIFRQKNNIKEITKIIQCLIYKGNTIKTPLHNYNFSADYLLIKN